MRAAVRAAFWDWTVKHEGYLKYPYLDIYGLPTTGVGDLLSTPAESVALPWKRADGSLASRDEILADWASLKASGCGVYRQWDTLPNGTKRIHCAWRGTGKACSAHQGHRVAATVTKLRLSDDDVRELVMRKFASNDLVQSAYFPHWETLCADAQLAVHSMAWAIGPHWPTRFPKLSAALRVQDFRTCAVESKLKGDDNPGVRGRNKEVDVLFRNAAVVQATGADPETLYFPRDLDKEPSDLLGLPVDSYRAEGPAAVVHAMPETVLRCDECGLVSCEGH